MSTTLKRPRAKKARPVGRPKNVDHQGQRARNQEFVMLLVLGKLSIPGVAALKCVDVRTVRRGIKEAASYPEMAEYGPYLAARLAELAWRADGENAPKGATLAELLARVLVPAAVPSAAAL